MVVQVRNFTEKDMSSLTGLINETSKDSFEFIPLTDNELRARLQEGKLKTLIAEENGEILGSVTYNDGYWGEEIRWLAVYEMPTRKTIENLLVARIEEFVKGEAVFTSIDADSPKTSEWIERGYKPEGGLYQMIARKAQTRPIPKILEGAIIRNLRPNEERQLVETVNKVFGWERLKLGFIEKGKSESPPFSEEWIHVGEVDNKIVSAVVAWPAVRYNKFFGAKRGYLGPAATLPDYRDKHLASTLTMRAMNFLFEKGMDAVSLHTSERNIPSVTLLSNLGFEIAHHWRFMRKSMSC
jgi:ribosomal protein S18 acetylase RimI-like enzyme